MSDAVIVALIGLAGVVGTPIVNHLLSARDRALASTVVQTKNAELELTRRNAAQRESTYRKHMTAEQLAAVDRELMVLPDLAA